MPAITSSLFIDGASQTGWTGTPLIELDGTGAGAGANGLVFASGTNVSTVRELVVSGFANDGIVIQSSTDTVQACYIGTNLAGSARWPTASLELRSRGARAASRSAAQRHSGANPGNLISGNTYAGILVDGTGTGSYFVWASA